MKLFVTFVLWQKWYTIENSLLQPTVQKRWAQKSWNSERLTLAIPVHTNNPLVLSDKFCKQLSCLSGIHRVLIKKFNKCISGCRHKFLYCGASCILLPLHSLAGPVGKRLLPATGGSSLHPSGAPTLLELGSPVSSVSLQWWSQRDPWSPATIGPLILGTGCFGHPSFPSSILTTGHRLMQHTPRIS